MKAAGKAAPAQAQPQAQKQAPAPAPAPASAPAPAPAQAQPQAQKQAQNGEKAKEQPTGKSKEELLEDCKRVRKDWLKVKERLRTLKNGANIKEILTQHMSTLETQEREKLKIFYKQDLLAIVRLLGSVKEEPAKKSELLQALKEETRKDVEKTSAYKKEFPSVPSEKTSASAPAANKNDADAAAVDSPTEEIATTVASDGAAAAAAPTADSDHTDTSATNVKQDEKKLTRIERFRQELDKLKKEDEELKETIEQKEQELAELKQRKDELARTIQGKEIQLPAETEQSKLEERQAFLQQFQSMFQQHIELARTLDIDPASLMAFPAPADGSAEDITPNVRSASPKL